MIEISQSTRDKLVAILYKTRHLPVTVEEANEIVRELMTERPKKAEKEGDE